MTQQINLLDPALLTSHDWCTGRAIVVGASVLAVALLGHGLFEHLALRRSLADPAGALAEATASPAVVQLQAQLADQEQRLSRDRALLQATAGMTDLPRRNAERLQALVDALPAGAWLREVEFSGERRVRIVGGALAPAALADFSEQLGRTPAFANLPLHVYAFEPLAATPAGDAPSSPGSPPSQPLYGFVLSSVEAATSRGTTP